MAATFTRRITALNPLFPPLRLLSRQQEVEENPAKSRQISLCGNASWKLSRSWAARVEQGAKFYFIIKIISGRLRFIATGKARHRAWHRASAGST
jgi:hypothetical protein